MKYIVRTKNEDILINVSSEEQLEKKVNFIKRFAEVCTVLKVIQ